MSTNQTERKTAFLSMSRAEGAHPTPLSEFIRNRRTELGLSLVHLEERTGLHNSRLSRWERGIEAPDRPERLIALAKGLEVSAADLYILAGVTIPTELPSLRPYLRSKYGDTLPPSALAEIAQYGDKVAQRYGTTTGPAPGQDENPPDPDPNPDQTEPTAA